MRAVIAQDHQPVIVEVAEPTVGVEDVLIRVKATALNRADLLQVRGMYPPPEGAPQTLGLELAGEVIGKGEAVRGFKIGDRVMALVAGGGYAEKAAVHSRHVLRVPHNLIDAEAAAIPEAFITAYSALIELGHLQAGERVLIHAGASGVGLAATQMAKALGATVIVTASAKKHDFCRAMGADVCIDYQTEDFAERLQAAYPSGVNLVLDMVGAPYWEGNMRVLAKWGRLVFIGTQGGATHEVNFGQIMAKRLTITGATLRNRESNRKTALIQSFSAWALPLLESGVLQPNVWRIMRLDEVAAAHALMASNANAGKIVLTL